MAFSIYAAIAVAVFGFSYCYGAMHPAPAFSVPLAQGSPAAIAANHDCWTSGEHGVIPGHVIVQITRGHGGGNVFYAGRRITGLMLDHLGKTATGNVTIDGKEYRVSLSTLYFCR